MVLKIIAGTLRGRIIFSPNENTTRPTTSMMREAVFNILQNEIEEATFLDLFGGSGSMSFEALSRGAKKAVIIEVDKKSAETIRKTMESLHIEESALSLLRIDVERAIEKLAGQTFSLIYIDPPYKEEALTQKVLNLIEEKNLLAKGGKILIESLKTTDLIAPSSFCLTRKKKYGSAHLFIYEYAS